MHQLFIDFKKAYDSVRREVLYNILIESGVPKKLVRLIKMCLTALGRRRRSWEDNIKMDLQEVGGGCGDWMGLAQDRDMWRALVITVRDLRVPNMREIS